MFIRPEIRPYQVTDEVQWLRCRVLAFLDTAYFDNVLQAKESYPRPSIELVAEVNEQIIGLIDVECETEPGSVCSPPAHPMPSGNAGMIWNLAVHPDYRRIGVGKALLQQAIAIAQQSQIYRFEAWTRDDSVALQWYEARGFQKIDTYFHVYLHNAEVNQHIRSNLPDLKPISVFAHYSGKATEGLTSKFQRIHACNRYDLLLTQEARQP